MKDMQHLLELKEATSLENEELMLGSSYLKMGIRCRSNQGGLLVATDSGFSEKHLRKRLTWVRLSSSHPPTHPTN
jgi:hypothetical protein